MAAETGSRAEVLVGDRLTYSDISAGAEAGVTFSTTTKAGSRTSVVGSE
jgi:hypothetical protein